MELEAEVSGKDIDSTGVESAKMSMDSPDGSEDEEMAGMVMTRKDRKLYEAIQKSKISKRERSSKLAEKRKKIRTREA